MLAANNSDSHAMSISILEGEIWSVPVTLTTGRNSALSLYPEWIANFIFIVDLLYYSVSESDDWYVCALQQYFMPFKCLRNLNLLLKILCSLASLYLFIPIIRYRSYNKHYSPAKLSYIQFSHHCPHASVSTAVISLEWSYFFLYIYICLRHLTVVYSWGTDNGSYFWTIKTSIIKSLMRPVTKWNKTNTKILK